MAESKIEWTKYTWNPITGCNNGCPWCYARRMAKRLQGQGHAKYRNGFAPTFHPELLAEPLRWRKPRTVFVCSMGDLFDPAITDEQIATVFGIIAACPQHRFLVLTKQPQRMLQWFARNIDHATECGEAAARATGDSFASYSFGACGPWPLTNLGLGVSITNQADADERIPLLLQTPAAMRFVSLEPMLGPVGFESIGNALFDRRACIDRYTSEPLALNPEQADAYICEVELDWIICGADSTRGAPELPLDWVRSLRDQCVAAQVPFFFKSHVTGGKRISMPELDGKVWDQVPEGF